MNRGIDYGMGLTNIDHATGIRYGVIALNSLGSFAFDDLEAVYPGPNCPQCGNDAQETQEDAEEEDFAPYRPHGVCGDYRCASCQIVFDGEDAYGEEPIGYRSNDPAYELGTCLDVNLFVTRAPYYTLAPFCSPCVPGAGDLDSAHDGGVKTYCLGHDWFEGGKAPYPVFRVSDNVEVKAEAVAQ